MRRTRYRMLVVMVGLMTLSSELGGLRLNEAC
jgi:hypothetical protein